MKNVLVTGSNGFIASNLLPILHQHNCQITAAIRQAFKLFDFGCGAACDCHADHAGFGEKPDRRAACGGAGE